ncbi:MAG TPA: hypothetical protein VHW70_04560 [Edaphobacter sp.]|jgi:hypothetical protein|nr:hypothetical protein [Edaphobacter sp.]
MGETNKIPALCDIWSHFELGELTKLVTALAAFSYATGVIAINTYLHGLGIVDFSFAKPKLLLTGILVLLFFMLMAGPPFLEALSMAKARGKTAAGAHSFKRVLGMACSFLCVLLIVWSSLLLKGRPGMGQTTLWVIWKLLRSHPGLSRHSLEVLTAIIVTVGIYIPIFIGAVCIYWAERLSKVELSKETVLLVNPTRFHFVFAALILVVSILGYIGVFTYTFYSVIPQEFGGGEPYFQSFAVSAENVPQLKQLGIPFNETNTAITQALPVLHETDALVAVWVNNASSDACPSSWDFKAVELDKKMISAMKVEDQVKSPSPAKTRQCED